MNVQKRWMAVIAAVAVVVGLVVAGRHELVRFALEQVARVATGYTVRIGNQRLGLSHGAFFDVHVTYNGEAVLNASRIDLYYSLRDLLPGSSHRFGLTAIAIDAPELTLIHHKDGSYNIRVPSGGAPPAVPGRVNPVPLRFDVRVRDGSANLIDQVEFEKHHKLARVHNVNVDLSLNSAASTHYTASGAFVDQRDEPFTAIGTIDPPRGYAMHRVRASSIPIADIGNFAINSPAAHILSGHARNIDVRYFAIGVVPNEPIAYHLGGQLDVDGAGVGIAVLAQPVLDAHGHIQVVDGVVFSKRLDARIAGVPVRGTGAFFNFSQLQFRLGVSGAGDLTQLRTLFAFGKTQPVRGRGTFGALIEGPVGAPIVVAHAQIPRAYYNAMRVDRVDAHVAVANGSVIIAPLRANYAGVDARIHGALTLATPPNPLLTRIAFDVRTTAARLPYINEFLPGNEAIAGMAVLDGSGMTFGGFGAFASERDFRRLGAIATFQPNGVADVAPFYLNADRGTAWGRYVMDRRKGTSAFWLLAQNVNMHEPIAPAFPGLTLPQIPAIGGRLAYGAVVGGGTSHDIVLAGRASAGAARIAGVPFSALDARFSGNLANASINRVHADGPWGSFDGLGSFSTSQLTARGSYAGTLQGLRPFIGGIPASGPVSGPVSIAITPQHIVVQPRDVVFGRGAQVHGIVVQRASGTMAYRYHDGTIDLYAADARVAGGRVVAAGTYAVTFANPPRASDAIALIGTGMRGEGLRGLGVPIDRGEVSVDGSVAAQSGPIPAFDGTFVLRNGSAQGFPVQGTGILALHTATLNVQHGVAALGSSYGYVRGDVNALASHAPRYALHADVPAADITNALDTLHLPSFQTLGVFNAALAIGGQGITPAVKGPIGVPGGAINGLPFIDARADVEASAGSVHARHGRVLVGTTALRFFARVQPAADAFGVRSSHATLSDFNNYFDTGDTLDGSGSFALAIGISEQRVATRGDIKMSGLRYRSLPIGDTNADWSSHSNTVTGRVLAGGDHGALSARGTIDFAPSRQPRRIIEDSRYDLTAKLDNLDLNTWLPAAGYPTIPLRGSIDASARVRGRFPSIALTGVAALRDGSFASMPIDKLSVAMHADGRLLRLQNVELVAPGIAATADGSVSLRPNGPLALNVHASSNDLPKLVQQVARRSLRVSGNVEGTMQIGGTIAAPTFAGAFDASNVDAYGVKFDSLFGSVRLVDGGLELRNAGATFKTGSATLAGMVPLSLDPFRIGPPDAPVSFDLALVGVDPALLDEFIGSNTKLGGSVDGHVGLTGTVHAPRISGRLTLRDGSFQSDFERVGITDTVATLTFDRTHADLSDFSARFGTGTVKGQGSIAFEHGFGTTGDVSYAFHAVAHGAQLDLPAYGRGTIDATLDLTRKPPGLALLNGSATLADAVIPFAAFLQPTEGGGAPAVAGLPIDANLNLGLTAGRNVRIRGGGYGAGLDIGARGEALLAGTLAAPTLDGMFTSTGGTLTYFDRIFTMQSASVTFTPPNGVIPNLRATARTTVMNPDTDRTRNPFGSTDVTITVTGSLPNINVAFASDPPGYSKEQIIALIAPFSGLVNGIAFNTPPTGPTGATAPSNLPGAPTAANGAALPGVVVQRENGTLSVGQEAFNLLNAQFTAGLLAPLTSAIGEGLGFSSLSLNLGYAGNVGVNFRRGIGRSLNAVYATTFGIPTRQSFGVEYAPSEATVAQLSFFFQNGPTQLFTAPTLNPTNFRVTTGQAFTGTSGFAFTFQRLFW